MIVVGQFVFTLYQYILLGFQYHLVCRGACFSYRSNAYCGIIMDRTLVLTDSAAYAKIGIYAGQLQYFLCSISKLHFNALKPNRLWRCGADLFANDAVYIHCPGKAPAPVVE